MDNVTFRPRLNAQPHLKQASIPLTMKNALSSRRSFLFLGCLLGIWTLAITALIAAEYHVGNHERNAEAFDKEMRSIPENATIHLTNAVYHTAGVWQINKKTPAPNLPGFRLKDGWRIVGQGTNRTTVKLTDVYVREGRQWQEGKNYVFCGWHYDSKSGIKHASVLTNVTIENLTIDCNAPDLTNRLSFPLRLSAIRMRGDNLTVDNVRVINAVSEQDNENFIISMKGKDLGNGPGRCYVYNAVIDQYGGGYCSGITIGGDHDDTGMQATGGPTVARR
jgi:hypothetical protein